MKLNDINRLLRREQNKPNKKAFISKNVIDAIYGSSMVTGKLFGNIRRSEELIQILSTVNKLRGISLALIGAWSKANKPISDKGLSLFVKSAEDIACFFNGKKIDIKIFDIEDYNLRNKSEVLSQKAHSKKVLLVSSGSVNSRIGYELAKHGVEIAITDPDYLDIANPYRWGIQQPPEFFVGRPKTIAFKEGIEQTIPNAKVAAFTKDFCKEIAFFDKFVDKWQPDLIVIATDTEDSRRDTNSLALSKGIPVLYIGLSDKAESGQIIYISGKKEDPCYFCFKGNNEDNPFTFRSTNKQYGIDSNEQRAVPALSIDINIISDIATKLAMVIIAGEDVTQYFKQFDNKGDILWFSTQT